MLRVSPIISGGQHVMLNVYTLPNIPCTSQMQKLEFDLGRTREGAGTLGCIESGASGVYLQTLGC